MIGRVIGPYEVSELIGRGGMGEVFKGRDTKLGLEVALKILPVELELLRAICASIHVPLPILHNPDAVA